MIENENDKPTTEETTESTTEQQSESKPPKKGFFAKARETIGDFATTIATKADAKIKESKLNNEIDDIFNHRCETYIISEFLNDTSLLSALSSRYKIKGIRNAEPNTIYIHKKESLFDKLKSGMTLIAESDSASFQILEKDSFTAIDFPIQIDENSYAIKCYRLKVKLIERTTPLLCLRKMLQQLINLLLYTEITKAQSLKRQQSKNNSHKLKAILKIAKVDCLVPKRARLKNCLAILNLAF